MPRNDAMLQADEYSWPFLSTRPVGMVTWACVWCPLRMRVIRPTLAGSKPDGGGPAGAPCVTSEM
jgi:hypothetical protein